MTVEEPGKLAATRSFAYRAQTPDGQPLSGTLDAASADEAQRRLESLRLNVTEIREAAPQGRPTRALGAEDFIAFNRQLAHLTSAGLPMERGLRLIAEDMPSRRLSNTVREVAEELESGKPLAEVFRRHRGRFPSLYASLIDAGVRTGNLPGILFNLARHLEFTRRLRGMLWRAAAYPLMVLAGLCVVLIFLSLYVVPQFEMIYREVKMSLPPITEAMVAASRIAPPVLGAFLVIVLALPLLSPLLRASGMDRRLIDRLVLPLPIVGPLMKRSMLAGWCDALRIGVEAGIDLPSAIRLAGESSGSPRLRGESERLAAVVDSGKFPDAMPASRLVPPTVTAAMTLGIQSHDLPNTLRSLTEMYQQQAETRLEAVPGIVSPLLLILTASLIALVIAGLMMPIVQLISAVAGPMK